MILYNSSDLNRTTYITNTHIYLSRTPDWFAAFVFARFRELTTPDTGENVAQGKGSQRTASHSRLREMPYDHAHPHDRNLTWSHRRWKIPSACSESAFVTRSPYPSAVPLRKNNRRRHLFRTRQFSHSASSDSQSPIAQFPTRSLSHSPARITRSGRPRVPTWTSRRCERVRERKVTRTREIRGW